VAVKRCGGTAGSGDGDNGVDNYERRFDPTIRICRRRSGFGAVEAVVYAIYWATRVWPQHRRGGQCGTELLASVTQATGGKSFWMGMGIRSRLTVL